MKLKDHFIKTIADELDNLNGTEFEQLCHPLIEAITDKEFEQKGLNLEMKPVKASSDLLAATGYRIIGQCGTDKDYFSGKKPLKDVISSINNNPEFTTIFLFCNRRATGKELQDVKKTVNDELKKNFSSGYHCNIYDSQRIANKIYNNVYKTDKIMSILSFLPKSFEYYLLLPQTNTIPLQKSSYQNRPEEFDVKEILKKEDFIQIFGLSGIGKSQITMAIANDVASEYDTVLWFDGKKFNPQDLMSVSIQRLNKDINLSYMLGQFKVLIIVDNLNEEVNELKDNFIKYNKKGSKCIVTSLQRSVEKKNSFPLSYVSDKISKAILCNGKMKPSDEQLTKILNKINGYPLILELSKNAVEDNDLDWNDIINISNITAITDTEKNVEFATRIVGMYKSRFHEFFNIIYGLDSTTISKLFIKNFSPLKFVSLSKSAILQDEGEYICSIHQVVLDAIKNVFEKEYSQKCFYEYIFQYLKEFVIVRDEHIYTFLAYHKDLLLNISTHLDADNPMRHYIILSYLYSVDTYTQPTHYIELVNQLQFMPHENEVDLRLYIEKLEIEQSILKDRVRKDDSESYKVYKNKILNDIESLKEINTPSFKFPAYVNHHIGKWYSSIKDYALSEEYLLTALQLNPKAYNSLLKLARNYHQERKTDKVSDVIQKILNESTIKDVPMSVRLGAYEIISIYEYKELRERFIDKQLEQFTKDIYATLSEHYSQTYYVLSKLANHWAFNFPREYSSLCIQLPLPLGFGKNMTLRKNYGKIKCAQYIFGNYNQEYKEKLYKIAEDTLSGIEPKDDFVIKDLIKLYLSAKLPKKAIKISEEFQNRDDPFTLQVLSKVFRENEEFEAALDCIEKAIAQEDPKHKEYCAAFRHDKALCLFKMKDLEAEVIFKAAIELQPNINVKTLWQKELESWKEISNDILITS